MRSRNAPRLKAKSDLIRNLVQSVRFQSAGAPDEAVYLVGFDWHLYHRTAGSPGDIEVKKSMYALQVDRCWRALVYVTPCVNGVSQVHVLMIGGLGFYTLNLHWDSGKAFWCTPRMAVYRKLDTVWYA